TPSAPCSRWRTNSGRHVTSRPTTWWTTGITTTFPASRRTSALRVGSKRFEKSDQGDNGRRSLRPCLYADNAPCRFGVSHPLSHHEYPANPQREISILGHSSISGWANR